jgi:hypothetical protein
MSERLVTVAAVEWALVMEVVYAAAGVIASPHEHPEPVKLARLEAATMAYMAFLDDQVGRRR